MTEIRVEPGDVLGSDGLRLYICQDCKQIIPVPTDDEPPPYKYDYLLHSVEEQHGFRGHSFAVVTVSRKGWEEHQDDVVREVKNAIAGGDKGFGVEYYAVKETFKEDAMTCWKQHQRNPACNDYMSDSKRLQPDTAKERKAAGLDKYRSDVFLCRFCPVHSLVMEAAKRKAGLYE